MLNHRVLLLLSLALLLLLVVVQTAELPPQRQQPTPCPCQRGHEVPAASLGVPTHAPAAGTSPPTPQTWAAEAIPHAPHEQSEQGDERQRQHSQGQRRGRQDVLQKVASHITNAVPIQRPETAGRTQERPGLRRQAHSGAERSGAPTQAWTTVQ